jgi:hypothetical protein
LYLMTYLVVWATVMPVCVRTGASLSSISSWCGG